MLLVALMLAAVPASLPEVQQRLEKERSAAQQLAARESTLLGRLADLERQIELEGRGYRAAQARLRVANGRVQRAERSMKQFEGRITQLMDVLGPRLLARYRIGREGYVRFLLGSTSIADVLRRKRTLDVLLQSDLDALADLRFQLQGAQAARDELAAARAEVGTSVQAESEQRAALEARIDQQRRVLASVQQEKALHEEAVHELEDAEKELTAKMGQLATRKPEPVRPAAIVAPELRLETPSVRKARGKLLFPVARGFVEAHFGRRIDSRFNTVTVQNGIDVRAKAGTAVLSVWPGKVVHAGWFKGYGNLLIVDHGDGIFSLMAHLDRLERAVGDVLQQGDEVGTVGDTGSLKGAYLYFELRDGQQPLDPERWLSRVRRQQQSAAADKGAGHGH